MNQPNYGRNLLMRLMTLFVSLFVVLGLFLVTFPQAFQTQAASAPNIISYQGRVLNANAVPVTDATLDMVFLLYDAASGGSCVWSNSSASCATTTVKAITVTDGLFSEDLGDTGDSYAAIGDSIFGDNASLYLEVRIEGETLTPRKQITAAPYALNADTVDGIDSTGFLSATGDTGTGDYDFTGAILLGASPLVFEGATDGVNQTTFAVTDPTGANTITIPDASGTLALTSGISLTGAYAGGQTMTVDATGDATIDLTGTTDFLIKDNGANFLQFKDDATVQFDPTTTSGTAFNVVGTTVTTGKLLSLSGTGLTSGRAIEIVVDNSLDNSTGAAIHLDYEPGSGNEEVDLIFVLESDCVGDASCSSYSNDNTVFSVNSTGEIHTDTALEIGTSRYQETSINGSGALTISSGGSSDLNFQSAGSSIILNDSDDLIVGSATVSSAPFGVDESLNTVYIGEGSGTDSALIMKASDADQGTIDYTTSDQWEFSGGNVDIGQSLAVGLDAAISASQTFTLQENRSTGFSTEFLANMVSSVTASGTGMTMLGITGTNSGASSTITDLRGIDLILDTDNVGATTTTGYGINVNVSNIAGTATTHYGVRAGASGATTNYAGYFHGAASYFDNDLTPDTTNAISGGAGDVYVNDQLEVGGTGTTTGIVIGVRPDELTTGIGLSIARPGGGTNFTNTTSGLVSFSVTDTSGTGHVLHLDQDGAGAGLLLDNGGSGIGIILEQGSSGAEGVSLNQDADESGIFIDQDGDTGATLSASTGGSIHIANTNNANSAFTIYSNEGATSASPLTQYKIDNAAFDQDVFVIESDSTSASSNALYINQLGTSGAAALDIDGNSGGFLVELFNDGNASTADGIAIQACSDANPGATCDYILFADGNGDTVGAIEGDGAGGITNASSGSDYAELFDGVYADFATGDVLGLASDGTVKLAGAGTQVIGAYSVAPNTLGNWREDWQFAGIYVPVALLGQVPMNVNSEGGSIQPGDYLTLSSVSGVATKATGPGFMVGQALESHTGGSGQIMVFIEPKWHALDSIQDDNGVLIADTLALGSLGTATSGASYNSESFDLRGSAWNGSSAVETAMTILNDVTTTSDYKLSIQNDGGDEVAFVSQSGDLAIAGNLFPSDRGTLQTDKYIYYDGAAGLGGNFMRTNAAGWATGSYDFAEMFPSLDTLVAGEVVIFATDDEHVARSASVTYDRRIAGIVSTQPGFLAGENIEGHVPIALTGRVPTFVNNENGQIAVGDPLTTSSMAGYAMKATEPGQIVGYAMEAMNGSSGSIIVFVRPSYYDGGPVEALPGVDNEVSGLAGSISDFTTTNSLDLATGSMINIGRLVGLGDSWYIDETGDFVTGGRITHLIKSYQGEEVETYVPVARETTVQLSGTIELKNGSAVVDFESIDPYFNDIISNEHSYRVFLTASSATNSLYAVNRDQGGFRIQESNGNSNTMIDWFVIAYHKDYAPIEVIEDNIAEEETVVEVIAEEEEVEDVIDDIAEDVNEDSVVEVTEDGVDVPAEEEVAAPEEDLVTEEPAEEPSVEEELVEPAEEVVEVPVIEEVQEPVVVAEPGQETEVVPEEEVVTEDPEVEPVEEVVEETASVEAAEEVIEEEQV
jgi:hypothetical protein